LIIASVRSASVSSAVHVNSMAGNEADELSALFTSVLNSLPYYNSAAKSGEQAKHTSDALRRAAAVDPEAVLLARIAGRLAGFCFSNGDDRTVWLSWFGVHPDCRKSGVGTALLERLEIRAHNLRSHKIWCDSRTDNEPSARLLRHQGYSQVCTLKRHWYGQDFFIWEKFVG
jgi:ribosomal protein S18 acetylase RimI-like enzyme